MRLVTLIGILIICLICGTILCNHILYGNTLEQYTSSSGKLNKLKSSEWNLDKVTKIEDEEGKELPLPKGFSASKVIGENKISTGFVIYEGIEEVTDANKEESQKTRNQYVWVPVQDINSICSEENEQYIEKTYMFNKNGRNLNENIEKESENELKSEIKEDYKQIIESIKKYGGFYIGRYETGGITIGSPKIVKNNIDIANNNWQEVYTNIKNMNGTNENILTRMIPASLFDETINWLAVSGCKTNEEIGVNSNSFGNYINSTFTYTTIEGEEATKTLGKQEKIPTGTAEYTKTNNIYDLAGNMWEWVTSYNYQNLAKVKAGGYSVFGNINLGYTFNCKQDTVYEKGARVILCIK